MLRSKESSDNIAPDSWVVAVIAVTYVAVVNWALAVQIVYAAWVAGTYSLQSVEVSDAGSPEEGGSSLFHEQVIDSVARLLKK